MESEKPRDLKVRTLEFAVRIIRLSNALPHSSAGGVIAKQILRSGTSVGASYREGCRSRSEPEIISKFEHALQELEETGYWLEVVEAAGLMTAPRLAPLRDEVNQLTAILVTCVKKIKDRSRTDSKKPLRAGDNPKPPSGEADPSTQSVEADGS